MQMSGIMNRRVAILLIACVLVVASMDALAGPPPIPFNDWGACPFECCTYRKWVAKATVTAYTKRNSRAPPAFAIRKGQEVIAVTGVVVTTRAGKSKLLKPVVLAAKQGEEYIYANPQAGELIYPLHDMGEGYELVWYKGRTYAAPTAVGEGASQVGELGPPVKVITRRRYEWWAKVKNRQGRYGWTMSAYSFKHIDQCE
jgi:hypothetical protein